jgi:FkbM family methyltransferase
MIESVRRAVFRRLRPRLQRLGFDVVRYDGMSARDRSRRKLLDEREIDVALDVGANAGQYAQGLRALGYQGRIVSFEPLASAFANLEEISAMDPAWECRHVALGAQGRRAKLNVAANSLSSSLLPAEERLVAAKPSTAFVGTEDCRVTTLDELRPHLLRPNEHVFLKLDVQGSELDVLLGAESTLQQVEVLDVELAVLRLYRGAPLLSEVVQHLNERGFGLVAIDPGLGQMAGSILEVDGLFARVDRR